MVDRPKSAMQARQPLLTSMFAFVDVQGVNGGISFRRNETHSFQISVYHVEVVHVLQATRNVSQLNSRLSVMLLRGWVTTYKLGAVYILIPLDELVDVSVLHPLGNESKSLFV